MNILIVDDDSMVRNSYARLFRGHTIHMAQDGLDALEVLNAVARVDVIVSDHDMPNMSGTELCMALRQAGRTAPFVLVSGNCTAVASAQQFGVNRAFMKPAEVSELVGYVLSVKT